MKILVQRQLARRADTTEEPVPPVSPPSQAADWPMVIWMKEGPVCVSIVEQPRHTLHDSVCHCGACRGLLDADWAERFLP